MISQPARERTDETIAEQFPDRGERPLDDVVVDPDADEAPDVGHPK